MKWFECLEPVRLNIHILITSYLEIDSMPKSLKLSALSFSLISALSIQACQSTAHSNVPLLNTYWKLITLENKLVVVPEGEKEPHLQLKNNDQVKGFTGCNQFSGTYQQNKNNLAFSNIASTRKMCVQHTKQEQKFLTILNETERYKVIDSHMKVFNSENQEVAEFKAVYF